MLVVTPAPFPDECMAGYLRRVSEANGFSDPRATKVLFSVSELAEPLTQIRHLLGKNGTWHQRIAGMTVATLLQANKLPEVDRFSCAVYQKFCPKCLSNNPYWRAAWGHVFVTQCADHEIRLMGNCSRCDARISSARSRLLYCDCGACLMDGGPFMAGIPEVQPLQNLLCAQHGITSMNSPSLVPGWPEAVQALNAASLEKLILFLGAYLDEGLSAKPRKLPLKADPAMAAETVTRAAHALAEWPASFHGLLARQTGDATVPVGLSRAYGAIYRIVYREFSGNNFAFLRTAFESFLGTRWAGRLIDRRNRSVRRSAIRRQAYLPAPVVMRRYGVSRNRIKQLSETGRVEARVVKTASGRERIEIARRSLRRLGSAARTETVAKAAERLGVAERRVRELVDAGLVAATPPRPGAVWRIPVDETERVRTRLRRRARNGALPLDALPLPSLFKFNGQRAMHAGQLVEAILAGSLPVWRGQNSGLGELLISRGAYRAWVDARDPTHSVVDAARMLGVKQQVAYHWAGCGLLPTVSGHIAGCRVREQDLRAFEREYVLAVRLARADRTSARALMARLANRAVKPVSGPGVDGGRQAIYRAADVAGVSARWAEVVARAQTARTTCPANELRRSSTGVDEIGNEGVLGVSTRGSLEGPTLIEEFLQDGRQTVGGSYEH